jgi:endonuclease YncB( thermonuclease family)
VELHWYRLISAQAIDGDTVKCVVDLGFGVQLSTTVRLLGVAAPELFSGDKRVEGEAARVFAQQWLDAHPRALLHTEKLMSGGDKREKYGRYLGVIVAEDRAELNAAMIDSGHARRGTTKG